MSYGKIADRQILGTSRVDDMSFKDKLSEMKLCSNCEYWDTPHLFMPCRKCDVDKGMFKPMGSVQKTSGYYDCPKCGDGYKFKGAAKKCCQRGK